MERDVGYRRTLIESLAKLLGRYPGSNVEAAAGCFEPVSLASGEVLYRRGEVGDSLHVVIAGRLAVSTAGPGGARVRVGHVTRGECVGEIALLTQQPRTADVVAIRDTVLAELSRESFEKLAVGFPGAALDLARFTIGRLTEDPAERRERMTVRSIALVPLAADVPLRRLARRLELALLTFGSATLLDERTAAHRSKRAGGPEVLDHVLDELEGQRRFVLYEADGEASRWSRKCVRQADRVLLVAWAQSSPELRAIERELFADEEQGGERELVLLHRGGSTPSGTSGWLAARPGLSRHHHVEWDGSGGVSRLGRFLAGRAVNLVLGGGGARGFAQIGAVRAIREAGVPIDAVGGCSIGAVIAAQPALGWDDSRILQSCKRAFGDERPLNDFAIPLFALLHGNKVSNALRRYFGDIDIVDLWTPYFCVSSNLTRSRMTVHRSGKLWQALRASVSLPGILPPVTLGSELHVDGGLVDNLPIDVMRGIASGRVIGVDTSVRSEYPVSGEGVPSALGFLRDRILRGRSQGTFPTLGSVIVKATTMGGSSGASASRSRADLYLNPPLERFDFLDWGRILEIAEVGYRYTREHLAQWIEANPEVAPRRPARLAG